MNDKKKMVKVSTHLFSRIRSVTILLMAIGIGLLVLISYKEHTIIDWVIFAIFEAALFAASMALRRLYPYVVMSDGEKLYIKNTVRKEIKEWNLTSFSAVYFLRGARSSCYLIFSVREMTAEEQKALYHRARKQKYIVLDNDLVFVKVDIFWDNLLPVIKDRVPFYRQGDGLRIFE